MAKLSPIFEGGLVGYLMHSIQPAKPHRTATTVHAISISSILKGEIIANF
jgi:hypothetical protein